MNIDGLQTGVEYYYDRSKSWEWFDGQENWWEIFVTISGFNGVGGLWIKEEWRWNNSRETIREDVRSTTCEQGREIIAKIKSHLSKTISV